jgi:hypothetical protein
MICSPVTVALGGDYERDALWGSARVSRAGDGVLAIVDFLEHAKRATRFFRNTRLFRRDAETDTRDACATQTA